MADDRGHKYSTAKKEGMAPVPPGDLCSARGGHRSQGVGVAAGELDVGLGVQQQRVGGDSGAGAGESGEVPLCHGQGAVQVAAGARRGLP